MDSFSALPPEITIITLNCWGLKLGLSASRAPRLREIARQLALARPAPSIVCLQEIWSHDDFAAVAHRVRARLPHAKFYWAGAFGAGLAILSRWPLEDASMVPYALNGRPTAFWRGDWFVGKGVACARVRFGPGARDVVDVFSTHTHAAYLADDDDDDDDSDSYRVHREAQAWQLAKLVRGAASRGDCGLVIAAGDFNMTPLSAAYRILTGRAPVLRDVWRVLHPDSDAAARTRSAVTTAEFNVLENGVTSDSALNTWRWPKAARRKLGSTAAVDVEPDAPDPRGKRLDYIFFSAAVRELDGGDMGGWVVKDARVGMMMRHPELGCSLSDHFSVEATLVFHRHRRSKEKEDEEGITSLRGGWPLPPGGLPASVRRRSTPLPFQAADMTAAAAADDDAAVAEDSPASGAFLSLRSPTPSMTSRLSLSASPAADYAAQLLSSSFSSSSATREVHLTITDYDDLLARIDAYVARESRQTDWRMSHFAFWFAVTICCYIVIWFIPTHNPRLSDVQNHAINFVLLLLSSLGLVAGVVDGLMALLFFRGCEKRALKEFEWEVRNARAISLGQGSNAVDELGPSKY